MIGLGKRVSYAFRSFFAILGSSYIPKDIVKELSPTPEVIVKPLSPVVSQPEKKKEVHVDSIDRAIQMLSILQRDGRLIDFFTEDIQPYSDEQIGSAIRNIHADCKQSLIKYVKFVPIISSNEGEIITIENNNSLGEIKLIGNVTGKLPMKGILRHKGWRAIDINLPPLPDRNIRSIIAPAEVEVSN